MKHATLSAILIQLIRYKMLTAEKLIAKLNLQPLAEGGFFQRIYESNMHDPNERRYGAAIYYLLKAPDFSCFHRIDCDELWHFYAGNPLMLYQINPNGALTKTLLGNLLSNEKHSPVAIVEKGNWFAAELVDPVGFSLVGCTTTPEFVYEAYEIGNTKNLCEKFPQHVDLITRLTFSS